MTSISSTVLDSSAVTRIAHFKIIGKLGQGGMGIVYRAVDEKLEREVALKVLPPAFVDDPERRSRFLREARSAAAVSHPNIATIHEVGEDAGSVYIAMELASGRSLRAIVAEGRLSGERAIAIARGIARGVARAHERGIVHRDLKPDNVMVGEGDEVKVLDFGLAKIRDDVRAIELDSASTAAALTAEGAVLGTPAYMSPEQMVGRLVDARSDVFSFGVMLYEMTTGVRPFAGNTMEMATRIQRDEPAKPSSIAPIGPALEAIILRCLRKEPEGRFANAGELLSALDAVAKPAAPPRRRLRLAVAPIAIGIVVVAIWAARHRDEPAATSALPSSQNAAADAAYRAALASLHAGTGRVLLEAKRAAELDPDFAAAHLLVALASRCHQEERGHYARAAELYTQLGDRDREILRALDPACRNDPPDLRESAKRLRELAERRNDAELWFHAAHFSPDPAQALLDVDHEIALAPEFAHAYGMKAELLRALGNFPAAIEATETCIQRSPEAARCAEHAMFAVFESGDCERAVREATHAMSVGVKYQTPYIVRAQAALAQGEPFAAAAALLSKATSAEPAKGFHLPRYAIALDILHGDFDNARQALEAVDREQARSPLEQDHAWPAAMEVVIAEETGDPATAAQLAATFLANRATWTPSAEVRQDPTALFTRAAHEDARETARVIDSRLKMWAATSADDAIVTTAYLWRQLFAASVDTAEDAEAALARLPSLELPHQTADVANEPIGRTFLRAGRTDEAKRWLTSSAHACNVLDAPVLAIRAHLDLGELYEKLGDKSSACAEYTEVVARWAKSVTTSKARARMTTIGC